MNAKTLNVGRTYHIQVARVIDGDTVDVLWQGNKYRIRLYGIDAPEQEQPDGPSSTAALRSILSLAKELRCEVTDKDKWGRWVGLIYSAGRDRFHSINLYMVSTGHAYEYIRLGGAGLGFENAERTAQSNRLGVWKKSVQGGERPWDFRRPQQRFLNKMEEFLLCNSRAYWVGHNAKYGLLIYDPKDQDEIELDEVKVRLFKVSRGKSGIFCKERVREKLMPYDEKHLPRMQKAVIEYDLKKYNQRYTHCYSCKHDINSVDFPTCEECGWIICGTCGACGCNYS